MTSTTYVLVLLLAVSICPAQGIRRKAKAEQLRAQVPVPFSIADEGGTATASHGVGSLLSAAMGFLVTAFLVGQMHRCVHLRTKKGQTSTDYLKQQPVVVVSADPPCAVHVNRARAEIKIGGMTCSACSGTVERHLISQEGVLVATVNLVLEKATVTFDSTKLTPAAVCDHIEDIGFESKVLSYGAVDAEAGSCEEGGRAELHIEASADAEVGCMDKLSHMLEKIGGTLGCELMQPGVIRVSYRPREIGARTILRLAREAFPDYGLHCATSVQGNEQTAGLMKHAQELQRNVSCSAVPAFLVFMITVVLPSTPLDLGTFYCTAFSLGGGRIQIHIATFAVLLLATPVQFVFGACFHEQARKALSRGAPNMDVLVSIATSISYAYALIVLTTKVCHAATAGHTSHHAMPEHVGMEPPKGVVLELGCHALHFFGMAPILMTVVLGGRLIETRAKIKTMDSLVRLMEKRAVTARIVLKDDEQIKVDAGSSGEEVDVPVELVQIGDHIRLCEGSHVPADGVLLPSTDSSLWVNEALLTGESAPVKKCADDQLLGGTTVASGTALMVASAVGSQTALGEIITLISNAQATKTETQRLASVVAGYFVMSVMTCSLLVFFVWLFLVETKRVALPPDMDDGSTLDAVLFAARFGVAVLMVACPCAMGLATPTAVMVSTGVAAAEGCLVKSAEALEAGASVTAVVLDKTGTITAGSPHVNGVVLAVPAPNVAACLLEASSAATLAVSHQEDYQGRAKEDCEGKVKVPPTPSFVLGTEEGASAMISAKELEQAFWWCVGVAEKGSDHPMARCLVAAAEAHTGVKVFPEPDDFRYKIGRGVSAVIKTTSGPIDIRIGNEEFLQEGFKKQTTGDKALLAVEKWTSEMRTSRHSIAIVHVVIAKQPFVLGAIALRDEVRQEAAAVIHHLQEKLGLQVWMCTGDASSTALATAAEVGIDPEHVQAEALPKQKAEKVEALRLATGGRVCMIGDGINDAPALAAADVGVTLGAADSSKGGAGCCALAADTADVVLVRSNLTTLATFLHLSKATMFTIRRNFCWAFVFNFCGLPLAAGVFYPRAVVPPLVAGVAMGLSSVLVVSSSLMLRWFRPVTFDA